MEIMEVIKGCIKIDKCGGYSIPSDLYLSIKDNPNVQRDLAMTLSHGEIVLMKCVHVRVDGIRSLHELIQQLKAQYLRNWNVSADKVEVESFN